MKSILILCIPFFVFAAGETLTIREYMSIHNTNNRPYIKLQKKSKMHRLHRINEKDAARITKEETTEESQSIKLIHRAKYLMFKIHTENYQLTINALDGSVMEIEKK